MGKVVALASQRHKKAAERGFREWRRLFRSVTDFDENTRWSDLPDEVLLFFCEESNESRHGFYDLIMSAHHLGNGHDFESQAFERLTILMNAYFFIVDQGRFELMRRLGWLATIPRAGRAIIEVVMDSASFDYAALLETPPPTPAHPAYQEDLQARGIDRAALVRKHTIEAIKLFKEKLARQSSAQQ
jgi:hypothetical protein